MQTIKNWNVNNLMPKTKYIPNLKKFGPINCDKKIRVMIRPTDFCNFSCNYCFSYSKNKNNLLSKEQLNIFFNNLITSKYSLDDIFFYIHGGEPFTYKYIWDMLDIMHNLYPTPEILIQTNFELVSEYHVARLLEYNNPKLKIAVSVHQDINQKEYLKRFKDIQPTNLIDEISVMYTTTNKKNLLFYKILKYHFSNVEVYSIFNEMQQDIPTELIGNNYSEVDKSYIMITDTEETQVKFDDFYKKGLNYSFKGMICEAGYQGILLNWDGNIYRCQADLFIHNRPLTNINEFKLPNPTHTTPIIGAICNNDCCLCDLEYTRISNEPTK